MLLRTFAAAMQNCEEERKAKILTTFEEPVYSILRGEGKLCKMTNRRYFNKHLARRIWVGYYWPLLRCQKGVILI